jgi:hypothetical protein
MKNHILRWSIELAAACVVTACSTSSPDNPGTPVSDAGMAGCSPLQSGCFVAKGAYSPPQTTPSCSTPGSPKSGPPDSHCRGVTPQPVSAAACAAMSFDAGSVSEAGGAPDTGVIATGLCGAPPGNVASPDSDYGPTHFGTESDDDDCKYHVSYETTPLCEKDGIYFIVKAAYLTRGGAPLTGACTFAELCLNDMHPGPVIDGRPPAGDQQVVEGPPGTYTVGPVQFDEAGTWTVRFHFNEICCDVRPDSPHGHAAFFVVVP